MGDCVGDFVGDSVGNFEGDCVGDFVGDCVGEFVGDCVGDVVGDCVGDFVGDCIGAEFGSAGPKKFSARQQPKKSPPAFGQQFPARASHPCHNPHEALADVESSCCNSGTLQSTAPKL